MGYRCHPTRSIVAGAAIDSRGIQHQTPPAMMYVMGSEWGTPAHDGLDFQTDEVVTWSMGAGSPVGWYGGPDCNGM
jgi:hypothetical protein